MRNAKLSYCIVVNGTAYRTAHTAAEAYSAEMISRLNYRNSKSATSETDLRNSKYRQWGFRGNSAPEQSVQAHPPDLQKPFQGKLMFLVKAGTVILIEYPKSQTRFTWCNWRPYTTKEDKLYDKEEVWDMVAVLNDHGDVPPWAERNITEHGYVVIKRAGKYAMVRPANIQYLD